MTPSPFLSIIKKISTYTIQEEILAVVKKIVFTGGPCAGKSTVQKAIEQRYGRKKVIFVPEAATTLFQGGFPVPGRDIPYSQEWQDAFQPIVFQAQLGLEAMYEIIAREQKAQLLICDRGIFDGAAYVPGGLKEYLEMFRLDEQEVYSRYDKIVHFESTAACNPNVYGTMGNDNRYEPIDRARYLEYKIREVWDGHPDRLFISGKSGIQSVIARGMSIVSPYINREVERKFVLSAFPDCAPDDTTLIQQGYLLDNGLEMRVRQKGEQEFFLGIKAGEGLERKDWEDPIPEEQFYALWKNTEGRRLVKQRSYVHWEDYIFEIDTYQDALTGLITLECEFPDIETSRNFSLPLWVQGAVEVTHDPRFKNKNLAQYGLPS